MLDVIHVPIAVHLQLLGHHLGKLSGVVFRVLSVFFERPGDVAVTKIVALDRKFYPFDIRRAFALGKLDVVGQLVDAAFDGVARVGDAVRLVLEPCVVLAFRWSLRNF